MSKRRQLNTAKIVVEVRRLQLEQARAEVQRRTQVLEHAQAREQQAFTHLNAALDGWRETLCTADGLSPVLAWNGAGAVASARTVHLRTQQDTEDATAHIFEKRTAMLSCERRAGEAKDRLKQARRRFARDLEERQASSIEDRYLSDGDRS
ncbi:hypothetical protein [Paraburkholderia sp. GAS82]|uniref:hypothetical protein n=1 Tax=Paraburkholderia sp. GAS82 TaxID=3035137 RepID=UPI003D1B0818